LSQVGRRAISSYLAAFTSNDFELRDLVCIAKTSKKLHEILLARNARSIWARCRSKMSLSGCPKSDVEQSLRTWQLSPAMKSANWISERDLVCIAKTSKKLHEILLARNARSIWARCRERINSKWEQICWSGREIGTRESAKTHRGTRLGKHLERRQAGRR
jgi:hypothetical protein